MDASIIVKDLVLVGGGHAHVHTLKMLGMDPLEGVRVTLITRDLETPYSGMLPGYVAGYYSHDECHIDLVKLCGFANIRLVHGEACDINVYEKKIYLKDNRPPVRYDVMSLDIGISPVPMPRIWGNKETSSSITPVKPIDGFASRWYNILERILASAKSGKSGNGLGHPDSEFNLRIVGGGAGGIELAFALHHRLHKELEKIGAQDARKKLKISILNRGGKLLDSHKPAVQKIIIQKLKDKGIATYTNTEIVESISNGTGKCLKSAAGETFAFDEVIWCTQGTAQPWLKSVDGLACTEQGFVKVGPTLESISIPDVYACGDVCHLTESPRPKAGVFAVRAGPPLTANLRSRLLGRGDGEQVKWSPQTDFLGIIGIGNEEAVASKGPLGIEGAFVWRLKDRIDRLWMKMYQVLPDKEEMMREMSRRKKRGQRAGEVRVQGRAGGASVGNDEGKVIHEDEEDDDVPEVARAMGQDTIKVLSKAKMRCGGCGSKIGATVLSRVLARAKSQIYTRPEVVAGAGDDAALVSPPRGDTQQLLVHTIDYFRSFIGDPYTFGKIAANHSLSDIHAMNGTPVTALALCVVPYGPEPQVESQLEQMLAGCLEVLKEEKCTLAGGHTSEGAEPALGLAVNGVADPAKVMRKGPLEADTVIVLTKALGTGTVLAADMRGKAKGRWVSGVVESMVQSNRRAAEILQSFNCRYCTDVTGFGFLGHLIEMIKYKDEKDPSASGLVSAVVDMAAIPTFEGAEECVEQGILSTLHPQNIRCSQAIGNIDVGKGSLVYPLLFDPQTAGGLIATVPRGVAMELINALHKDGYTRAAVVGEIVGRTDDSDFTPLVHLKR